MGESGGGAKSALQSGRKAVEFFPPTLLVLEVCPPAWEASGGNIHSSTVCPPGWEESVGNFHSHPLGPKVRRTAVHKGHVLRDEIGTRSPPGTAV